MFIQVYHIFTFLQCSRSLCKFTYILLYCKYTINALYPSCLSYVWGKYRHNFLFFLYFSVLFSCFMLFLLYLSLNPCFFYFCNNWISLARDQYSLILSNTLTIHASITCARAYTHSVYIHRYSVFIRTCPAQACVAVHRHSSFPHCKGQNLHPVD